MTRLIVHSKVDADGILRLAVPVGSSEADRDVQVTIESTYEVEKTETARFSTGYWVLGTGY